MLKIVTFVLGPVQTNAYLAADTDSGETAVIDPAWDGKMIANEAGKHGWRIEKIWLTHAHFDHMAGAAGILDEIDPPPPLAMHEKDLPLWRAQGGAPFFGIRIDPAPEPGERLIHGQMLNVGEFEFRVLHTPGHTPGHVIFHCGEEKVVFCGDVIFNGSIGRTDLPGGSYQELMDSIRGQILTLPDDTRLLSGHGPETTVGKERLTNPFLV